MQKSDLADMADLAEQFEAADRRLKIGAASGVGEEVPEECKELLIQIAQETEAAGKATQKPAEGQRVPLPGMQGYAAQLETAVENQDL